MTSIDMRMMEYAIKLADECPEGHTYSVGCVIAKGEEILATGYSREVDDLVHAEECAIQKMIDNGISFEGVTIYTTMEPCSIRNSRPKACSQLILENGIKRVVFACYEPSDFQDCKGEELLKDKGVEVIYLKELHEKALKVARKYVD